MNIIIYFFALISFEEFGREMKKLIKKDREEIEEAVESFR